MKSDIENHKHIELQRWYKMPASLVLKKVVHEEISKLKETIFGNHVLYLGLTEFKK